MVGESGGGMGPGRACRALWTIVSSLFCIISRLEDSSDGLGPQQGRRIRIAGAELRGASSCRLRLTPDSRLPLSRPDVLRNGCISWLSCADSADRANIRTDRESDAQVTQMPL